MRIARRRGVSLFGHVCAALMVVAAVFAMHGVAAHGPAHAGGCEPDASGVSHASHAHGEHDGDAASVPSAVDDATAPADGAGEARLSVPPGTGTSCGPESMCVSTAPTRSTDTAQAVPSAAIDRLSADSAPPGQVARVDPGRGPPLTGRSVLLLHGISRT